MHDKNVIVPIMFSIIIPAFNSKDTLDCCLRAIRMQRLDNYELIVVDDASLDSTVNIAQKYGANVISNPNNKGAAYSRNMGAKVARGEILLFIDSDVVLSSKNVLKHIDEDLREMDICGVVGIYDKEIVFKNFFSAYKHLYMCYFQHVSKRLIPAANSAIMAVPRRKYIEIGGFNEKFTGVMAEDVEFSIKLASIEKKPFYLDARLTGLHFKKYNLVSLLKTDFMRIKGISKTLQNDAQKNIYINISDYHSGKSLIYSTLAMCFFMMAFVWPIACVFAIILIGLFVSSQSKLYNYMRQNSDLTFAVLSVCFSFVETIFGVASVLYCYLYYKIKEK